MELLLLSIDFTFCQSKRCPRYCNSKDYGCDEAKRCLKNEIPESFGGTDFAKGIPRQICVDQPVQNPNTALQFKGKGADEMQEVSRASTKVADDAFA